MKKHLTKSVSSKNGKPHWRLLSQDRKKKLMQSEQYATDGSANRAKKDLLEAMVLVLQEEGYKIDFGTNSSLNAGEAQNGI